VSDDVTALPLDVDLRTYCLDVEDHLTRVNGGHLVRIVGPAFDVVRGWAVDGIPIGIVRRGIEERAERHQTGQALRPLRVEFCDADVRLIFAQWRRAVGLTIAQASADVAEAAETASDTSSAGEGAPDVRQKSLSRLLQRAIDRLSRAAGHTEFPEPLRDGAAAMLDELSALRERARTARGDDRRALADALPDVDRRLIELARASATPDVLAEAERDARQDLDVYRARLSGDAWTRAIEAAVDHRLRERFGLPTVEI
jgi:hypothetical protein